MSSNDAITCKYTQFTNAANVTLPTAFSLNAILCSSSTSGTVKIWDNSAASGAVVVDTITLTAGQSYPIQAMLKNGLGCFITVGGTFSATLTWN